ncbi:MAG: hypothetical protein F4Z69_10395, partial [Bacteroidetes bacterium SB0668_bin_1]|nr:hypothetical protein [Bacteroidetes bacterium SB0668_bin_1]
MQAACRIGVTRFGSRPESRKRTNLVKGETMGFWKVLGGITAGALAGVGGVILLPIAGPIGVATAAAAATAAGVGGVTGGAAGAVSTAKGKEKDRELNKVNSELAKEKLKTKKRAEHFVTVAKRFEEHKKYEEFLIAAMAVGISIANADGDIAEEERVELEEYLMGPILQSACPKTIKNRMQKLYKKPPTFNEAMKYVEKIRKESYFDPDVIDDIIILIMNAD